MNSTPYRPLALLMCGLISAAPAFANPAALNDKLLDALRKNNNVPGMSAAIIKDGKLVWQGSAGFADVARKIPVDASTRFRLASVSKFVTTLMLARLVEQNRITLSDPVARYLPDYPAKSHAFNSLQLASHSAGMPHYDMVRDANRDEAVVPFKNVAAGLAVFKDRDLIHRPGTKFHYSSFGFNLLAAVMERAAGKDFLAQLAELSATAGAPSLEAEQIGTDRTFWSALYEPGGMEVPRGNVTYNWAGGGMLSNAADLARIGALTLDTSYISRRTLNLFTAPVLLADGSPVTGENFTMGIGWRLNTDQHGRRIFHHSGVTRGARSHISVYPEQRLVVAILSNASWVSAIELTSRSLAEQMMDDNSAAVARPCTAGNYAYRGTYKEKPISGTVRFDRAGHECSGVFVADNALGTWLANGSGSGFNSLALYGRGDRLSMVTPLGLFPVTRKGDSMTLAFSTTVLDLALERLK